MTRKLTFLDSGVLFAAYRGTAEIHERALSIVGDANRDFVTNQYLALELLPKPTFHKQDNERQFYESFLAQAARTVQSGPRMCDDALRLGKKFGLSAIDSLHATTALAVGAAEFITAEKAEKPLFRVAGLNATSIADPARPQGLWGELSKWLKRRWRRIAGQYRKWRGGLGIWRR